MYFKLQEACSHGAFVHLTRVYSRWKRLTGKEVAHMKQCSLLRAMQGHKKRFEGYESE